jgi:ATP-dependent DNA helicase DinG
MRPFQDFVLAQVEAALAGKKRFIIIEAPTGLGKSAVAVAAARYLGSAYILTATKQLQDQYTSSYGIPMATGKANWTCRIKTKAGAYPPCSQGACEAGMKLIDCPHYLPFKEYDKRMKTIEKNEFAVARFMRKFCPYYSQKFDALRAPVMVANYPFFLAEAAFTSDLKQRKLIVLDEAHDLEHQLVSFAAYVFRRSTLYNFTEVNGRPVSKKDVVIHNMGHDNPLAWVPQLQKAAATLGAFIKSHAYDFGMQERLVACRNALGSLNSFLRDLKARPDNWVVNSIKSSTDARGGASVDEVTFQSLDVSPYTKLLFDYGETVILMSATIISKELFCKTLGIPETDAVFVSVKESTFPVENRKIYVMNTAHLNKDTIDASLESITKKVDEIMTFHTNERGIIHTTTYSQAKYIAKHVSSHNRERLMTTEKVGSVASLLQSHGNKPNSVLISPSLNQGVDLKDDLARFAVIVKVPYPYLGERRTRVKQRRDYNWYTWQTVLRIIQTYGRSVRSETDHSVTYILDSNFTRLLEKHRGMFPGYFLDAIQTQQPATVKDQTPTSN